MPPIISHQQFLASHADAVLCDCRAYLDDRNGADAYSDGHIPGARFVDLATALSAEPITGSGGGRHPLPSPEAFATSLSRAGIGHETAVVAYDDAGGMIAGRLVWMLRVLGQPAALLDGGIGAWVGELERTDPEIVTVANDPRPWPKDATVSVDEITAHLASGGVVIDSRAPDRYRGETEPIDPVAGHIPGAKNLPFSGNLIDGMFAETDALTQRFSDAGVDADTIYYCGSGVSACNNMLAAEAAGLGRGRLYVGSWSGWVDLDQPVAIGEGDR